MDSLAANRPQVLDALTRILASAGFVRNERQSQFLRFLVERQLEGKAHELKESVLGVEVFGRTPGYDPKIDGIVRTEAIRLRARLNKYYAAEGSADALVIELPKGGYRPVFRVREQAQTPVSAMQPVAQPAAPRRTRWFGAAVAAAVMLAAVASWAWMRSAPAAATVAVLPLENLSANADSGYFSDGLTDEIIRNLSLVDGLTVPSRASSFALKGKRLNAADAGRQLGVDFLVEGSVLHEGDRLRVNVELVRVRDDARLWSNRFDRKLHDVFAIQDEISYGIANALRVKLGAGRREYEANMEAYDLYLRGRQAMAGFPAAGRNIALTAVQFFERAIATDAGFALAHAGEADALLAIDQNVVNPEAYHRARVLAERAVALDPMLSEAQSALASVRAREYDWSAAETGYRRALALNPNNALAHLQLGASVLILQERFDDGLAEVRRAVMLDPLSPYVVTEAGRALLWAGRTDEAIQQLRRAITLDPSRGRPYGLLARALVLTGHPGDARTVVEEARRRGQLAQAPCTPLQQPARQASASLAPESVAPRKGNTAAAMDPDARVASEADPAAADALRASMRGPASDRTAAQRYACNGDEARAVEHLEKALAQDEPGLAEMVQAPEWAAFRSNARFASLRRRMHLPS